MAAFLNPVSGGKPIVIDKAVIMLGRHPTCDAVLTNSRKVSRKHCCVVQVNDSFFLRDLGSMNGCKVNEKRVRGEAPLNPGDAVLVGDIAFQFLIAQARANGAAPAAPVPAAAPVPTAAPVPAPAAPVPAPALKANDDAQTNASDETIEEAPRIVEEAELANAGFAESAPAAPKAPSLLPLPLDPADPAPIPVDPGAIAPELRQSSSDVKPVPPNDGELLEEIEIVEVFELDDVEEIDEVEVLDDVEVLPVNAVEFLDDVEVLEVEQVELLDDDDDEFDNVVFLDDDED